VGERAELVFSDGVLELDRALSSRQSLVRCLAQRLRGSDPELGTDACPTWQGGPLTVAVTVARHGRPGRRRLLAGTVGFGLIAHCTATCLLFHTSIWGQWSFWIAYLMATWSVYLVQQDIHGLRLELSGAGLRVLSGPRVVVKVGWWEVSTCSNSTELAIETPRMVLHLRPAAAADEARLRLWQSTPQGT